MMKLERCEIPAFAVIGKEGSTNDGEGFVAKLWEEANKHFNEVAELAAKDEDGNLLGIWGAMSDMNRAFQPWENEFTEGLYLAGVQCSMEQEPPEGWTKWVIPSYEYLYTERTDPKTFSQVIDWMKENQLPLAGAVHDFTCPQTGKNFLFFPIKKLVNIPAHKRKDMRRSDWKRILKRKYVWDRCTFQEKEGIASLILIREVVQPLVVRNGDHEVTIVDQGMSWLQIAFRNQYVWVTAMFDRHDRLLQIYFDITDGNQLEPADNPTFEDMYLDIVMEPDGSLFELDREELDEAYATGIVSEKQYQKSISEGQKLYCWLKENGLAFAEFCCTQMKKLKGQLKDGTDRTR